MFYSEPDNILIFKTESGDLCVKIDIDNDRVFIEERSSDGYVTIHVYTFAFALDLSKLHCSGVDFESYIRKVVHCDE